MKIVHLCLASFFVDNYTYQENLLPKYHKMAGHDVTIIASLVSFSEKGKPIILPGESIYETQEGCRVYRVDYKRPFYFFNRLLRRYKKLQSLLDKERPDMIFIHGVQFANVSIILKYKKKYPSVRILCDNHADWINSARNLLSKKILHGIIWRYYANKIEPYVTRFYGVTPLRCEFLKKMYNIPSSKVSLLVMGVDDWGIPWENRNAIHMKIRNQLNIAPSDFLIITGGKIDERKNIHLLMEAVLNSFESNIHLVVFGNIAPEMKKKIDSLEDNEKIHYVGWLSSEKTIEYFFASDLAVFPGTHSVLWEQAVGIGIPSIFKYWDGMTHVDLGGNCLFLFENSSEEISKKISSLSSRETKYLEMKKIASCFAHKFYYSDIAKKVIEDV